MSVSIRIKSLHTGTRGSDSLSAAEAHGKRLDASSAARRVRDRDPLIYGSMDLRAAYNAHVEGCRMNKALKKPIQHAVIHFPNNVRIDAVSERKMLKWAVDFINAAHGGDAVFAARLDRDEAGQHNVDVFFTPKYVKHTKSHGDQLWISPTKFGKELCHKHKDELVRRDKHGEFKTGPRQVGIALNSELRSQMALEPVFAKHLVAKKEKAEPESDWVSPEAYKLEQRSKDLDSVKTLNESLTAQVAKKEATINAMVKIQAEFTEAYLKPFIDLLPKSAHRVLQIFAKRAGKPDPVAETDPASLFSKYPRVEGEALVGTKSLSERSEKETSHSSDEECSRPSLRR